MWETVNPLTGDDWKSQQIKKTKDHNENKKLTPLKYKRKKAKDQNKVNCTEPLRITKTTLLNFPQANKCGLHSQLAPGGKGWRKD